ncbi:MAG: hypothetical protein M1820_005494 [Bogoriella megaspora]|nr:MAG: hypothetical protein M1820_005494 [Bogoriella megaspora]
MRNETDTIAKETADGFSCGEKATKRDVSPPVKGSPAPLYQQDSKGAVVVNGGESVTIERGKVSGFTDTDTLRSWNLTGGIGVMITGPNVELMAHFKQDGRIDLTHLAMKNQIRMHHIDAQSRVVIAIANNLMADVTREHESIEHDLRKEGLNPTTVGYNHDPLFNWDIIRIKDKKMDINCKEI